MTISQSYSAIKINNTVSFYATEGMAPYTYEVLVGGAGGSINQDGIYTAPSSLSDMVFDTIKITDSGGKFLESKVYIYDYFGLCADIIQKEMNLPPGRMWYYNQQISQPKDRGIFISLKQNRLKPFANRSSLKKNSNNQIFTAQSINFHSVLEIDVISQSTEALMRKEEIILALNSDYSKSQQEKNGFYVAPISTDFINLSAIDGGLIPYRFQISFVLQYSVDKQVENNYFDNFQNTNIITNN